jgi:hypothetical protein
MYNYMDTSKDLTMNVILFIWTAGMIFNIIIIIVFIIAMMIMLILRVSFFHNWINIFGNQTFLLRFIVDNDRRAKAKKKESVLLVLHKRYLFIHIDAISFSPLFSYIFFYY